MVAPVAVEPREIIPPRSENTVVASPEPGEADHGAAAGTAPPAGGADAGEIEATNSAPIIPILAGIIAVVVLGLLVKVLKAK